MESKFSWTKQSKSQCQSHGLKITLQHQCRRVLEIINPHSHFQRRKRGSAGGVLRGRHFLGTTHEIQVSTLGSESWASPACPCSLCCLIAVTFIQQTASSHPAPESAGSPDPREASSLQTVKIPNPGSARRQQCPSQSQGRGLRAPGRTSAHRPCVCGTHSCRRRETQAEARGVRAHLAGGRSGTGSSHLFRSSDF